MRIDGMLVDYLDLNKNIQAAQLFLSVLIQFLTSNDWDARITTCLCPDCRRACLGAQFRFIQLNKLEVSL